MIGHVLPGARLTIVDRDRRRADGLAATAAAIPGIGDVRVVDDPAAATRDADVVVSAASFTDPAHRQVMDGGWLAPDALIVPVDYATMLAASVAHEAGLFLVDDVRQFVDNRDAGQFAGYPDPTASIGAAIRAGISRPTSGRVIVTHLGVGLADVIFGDAIVRRATAMGLGVELSR
jgi:ornithine cyclodeaminase/alanine dehydrogenase-like protein (mu-crystallin family)